MTNSLKDILDGRAKSNEPIEFGIIKRYMMKNFKIVPKLAMNNKNIIITVPHAAVAGSLRMSLHELKEKCKTDKRLVIRIGQ